MDLRLTIEGFTRLHDFAAKWNITKSDVVRKAEKKWDRLKIKLPVERLKKEDCSTLKLSIKIRNYETDKTPAELRNIIPWYINDQEAKDCKQAPLELEDCKKYTVVDPEKF